MTEIPIADVSEPAKSYRSGIRHGQLAAAKDIVP